MKLENKQLGQPQNQPENKSRLKKFHCRNKQCRAALCLTDGEYLYVAGLEIMPKLTGRSIDLVCPVCREPTRWFREK